MSRTSRVLLLLIPLVFVLACSLVSKPFNEAQNAVETAQSFATSMPIETLQALATSMPVETLQALPSAMPDIQNAVDPQGTPVQDWNGIPVIPSAFTGEETSIGYSFKANATTKEVFDYYEAEMTKLGWTALFNLPDTGSGALLSYQKDNHTTTVTITKETDTSSLVFLAYQ
ncbi:MAG: hypothetical protein IPP66_19085 [Anaerolineales bacterium]|nr:hypothetical protein [Anaerolineales bacterium]